MPYAASLIQDINWTKTSDSPFTLEFTDPNNANIKFKIVGVDGGSNPNSFVVTATKTKDDAEAGTTQRVEQMGVVSTITDPAVTVPNSITPDMFRRMEHWCREQRERFTDRPPAGLGKSPYTKDIFGY